MNNITIRDNQGTEWVRVSKPKAQTAYNDGQQITLCPVKLHPFGSWNPSVTRAGGSEFSDFARLDSDFKWLNCSHEAGNYPAYYIKAD